MIGVGGKPFLDIENKINLSQLEDLHDEIIWGLACATNVIPSTGSEYHYGRTATDLYDTRYQDVADLKNSLSDAEKERLANLDFKQQCQFLKFKGAYFPWSSACALLEPGSWALKHWSYGKKVSENTKKLFPKTLSYIYDLPFFESIGRIEIFGVEPCHHVTCHRDEHPESFPYDDEFIMLCPKGGRPFYLYDEIQKEKIYVNSRAFIFHGCDFHGVDPLPHFHYSIRIDGEFKAEFKKSIHHGRGLAKFPQRPPDHLMHKYT